jgi:hypothetical protein
MVLKKYLELEVLVFILAGAAAGYFLLVHQTGVVKQTIVQSMQTQPQSQTAIATNPTTTPVPTVTPIPTLKVQAVTVSPKPTVAANNPTVATTSQISSDGTETVIVNTTQNKDGNQTYLVSVNNGPVIYSETLPAGSNITIPYNTWSPDNTYFFLQKNSQSQTQIMVFNGNGQPFSNGQAFLDLTGVFAQDAPNADFGEATGWAADNLIIILTKNADGSEGTSYWFGVPDESVTPLATQF